MEKFTIIIASIGCISGIIGVLMHFYNYSLSRARIKLALDKPNGSFLFDSEEFGVKGFQTNLSGTISLKISNSSSHPVTIDKIEAWYGQKIIRHYNDFSFRILEIPVDDNTVSSSPISKGLELPLRINSFDTVYGCLKLPFCDCIPDYDPHSSEFVTLSLKAHSPRGISTLKVKLCGYHNYHQGSRPEELAPFWKSFRRHSA